MEQAFVAVKRGCCCRVPSLALGRTKRRRLFRRRDCRASLAMTRDRALAMTRDRALAMTNWVRLRSIAAVTLESRPRAAPVMLVRNPEGNCSDLRGSSAFPTGCGRVAKHRICFANRSRPLKREQLPPKARCATTFKSVLGYICHEAREAHHAQLCERSVSSIPSTHCASGGRVGCLRSAGGLRANSHRSAGQ